MTLRRRTLLAAAGAALLPGTARAAGGRIVFDAARNERAVGRHRIDLAERGETLTVTIAIDLRVGLGPITFYRYTHRNEERWRGGRLLGFASVTDDNGTEHRVTAAAAGEHLAVEGTGGRHAYPLDAFPTTYWHRRFLDRPTWINTQTGAPAACRVRPLGRDVIPVAGGTAATERFAVAGDLTMELWYRGDAWAGLLFPAEDGSTIRYTAVEHDLPPGGLGP